METIDLKDKLVLSSKYDLKDFSFDVNVTFRGMEKSESKRYYYYYYNVYITKDGRTERFFHMEIKEADKYDVMENSIPWIITLILADLDTENTPYESFCNIYKDYYDDLEKSYNHDLKVANKMHSLFSDNELKLVREFINIQLQEH